MHELISGRWSARGYDDQATITAAEVATILDAGRWAPTWGRIQPVRFIVGLRGDDTFDRLAKALSRGNIGWAPRASALVLVCTTNDVEDAKAQTYGAVDLGLAVSQMLIQSEALGYNAHPMAGFDVSAVTEDFALPVDKRALLVVAVGRLADSASLPPEIVERDARPRTRLGLDEVAFTGTWGRAFGTG
ncbi:nitroreductase family protein [Gordonia sp. ABSL1-1]|uniref:nitroreductase family protein n=1 Tax=Gordonia sp. ABSL1-1 TaxID=3053923 RepID=UPI002573BBBE|nr:nitroreductase family protein [Gordonia sp. ABSL1-1]MDL9937580.1 nitroreductase family protein [Gordonia sp. ABSL1-1]